jgi:hypothetical protein
MSKITISFMLEVIVIIAVSLEHLKIIVARLQIFSASLAPCSDVMAFWRHFISTPIKPA